MIQRLFVSRPPKAAEEQRGKRSGVPAPTDKATLMSSPPSPNWQNRFITYWGLLSPAFKVRSISILVLTVFGTALETMGIGLVIPAVALMTYQDITDKYPALAPLLTAMGNPSQQKLVIYGVLLLLSFYVLKALFLAFMVWKQSKYIFDVKADVSQRLFEKYLCERYENLLQRNTAHLIRNITTEATELVNRFLHPAMLILTELMVLIAITALLFYIQPLGAALLFVITVSAIYVFQSVTRRRLQDWGSRRQRHEGLRIQRAQEGLGGAKDIKLLGREHEFIEQYREHNLNTALVDRNRLALAQIPRLWLETNGVLGLALLVVVVVSRDNSTVSLIPTIGAFGAATFRILPSAVRLLGALQSVRYSVPVIDLINKELGGASIETPPGDGGKIGFAKEIEVSDVSYTYPGASIPSLRGLSFTIRQGESLGVIGASGAGKTTLVDVLLGLLTPTTGQILVDGKDVQGNLRSWQNLVGYVQQSIFLTDDTLRRNVAFGLPDDAIDEDAVRRALDAAQLTELVASLPDGIETLVGERGIRLSGGQRQRIGIARALYHDPPVLVFDEATSALDVETEKEMMESIFALQGSRTMVIVAHRLSTVEHCDRILKLGNGTMVDGCPVEN
jgi:ABC-type multidrug transport system fused ATPase/permease subunit